MGIVAGMDVVPCCICDCPADAAGVFFVEMVFGATLPAAAFFGAGFFFAAGLAGIGMVMPGICIWAAAGAASWASASALAAMSNLDFKMISPVKEATRETRRLPIRAFS